MIKMEGKVCLVTGANGSIGKYTALGLAQRGATVVMVCRNRAKGEAAQREIISVSGNEHVDLLIADMSSLVSVRQLAQDVLARYPQVHVLINNAGGMLSKRTVTVDGLETTWAANYVGPFLLTRLLLDRLKASAPARIVNVGSVVHKVGKLNFNDLQGERHYSGTSAYGQAKLAVIMSSYDLARRLEGTGVTVNVLHPGGVQNDYFGQGVFAKLLKLVLLTPEQGAQTSIYLATSPDVESISGKYFTKSKVATSSKRSHDEEMQKRLWDVTEDMIEEKGVSIKEESVM
jgi:NAD(P)-dependent dehydrogenase (short-subunit alcohol dehydrogenase family)